MLDPRRTWGLLLQSLLESSSRIEGAPWATSLANTVDLVRRHNAALAVVDWDVEEGIRRAITVLRSLEERPVVIVTGIDHDRAFRDAAMKAGAGSYVAKDSDLSIWAAAIERCVG